MTWWWLAIDFTYWNIKPYKGNMEEANSFKKRNVIGDKIEWPVSKVNSLIDLYASHPLLYNNRLKEYHNINLRTTH